jgi:hypothetical protein
MCSMLGMETFVDGNNGSAKVWFQEKSDIGRCLDVTDLEQLTEEFVKEQLLR